MCRQAQAVGAKINLTVVRARPRKAVIAVVRSVLDLMAKRMGYDTIGMGLWQGPKQAIRDIVSIALNINILKITNKLHLGLHWQQIRKLRLLGYIMIPQVQLEI